jgi:uncharacterized cupin superfamily protein
VSGPVNVSEVAVAGDPDAPAGFRSRGVQLGPDLGAAKLGGSVYELDPGESICPYHWEGVEEEWLLVLSGTPTLRDPDGEHELTAGDVVCFPRGPEGAHKITNRGSQPLRVLMVSSIPAQEISICVYPDSNKVSIWPPGVTLEMDDPVGYWHREVEPPVTG